MRRSFRPAFRPGRASLGFRLALGHAAVFALGALVLVAVTDVLLGRALAARDRADVRERAGLVAAAYAEGGVAGAREEMAEQDDGRTGLPVYVRLLDGGSGRVLAESRSPRWARYRLGTLDRPAARADGAWTHIADVGPDEGGLDALTLALGDGRVVQVGRPASARVEVREAYRAAALLVVGPTLLAVLIGGLFFTRRALRPLRRLAATAEAVARTADPAHRVPVTGRGDELDALAALVNAMLDRLDRLLRATRETLDAAAHDLRTPLARLRAQAEAALALPPDHAHEALGSVIEEADALADLLRTLLSVAEADAGALRLDRRPLKVAEAAGRVVRLYSLEAEARGVHLTADVPPALTADADPTWLGQALANLVDNALAHTPPGGHVTLTARPDGHDIAIAVHDTGAGIAEADLPRIWDRHFRGDTARTTPGLGLGLTLVRAIAAAHGGRAEAESRPGEGSTFTLRLPQRGHMTSV